MTKSYTPSVDERGGSSGSSDGTTTGRRVVRDFVVPILLGGIIAGTLDIGAASLINGAKPTRILQVIASGLFGKSAFADDSTVVLGLVLQWAMSIIIASIFVVAAQWRPVLKRHWVMAGLAYGLIIYFVMNYGVLPLSAIGHPPRFRVLHFMEDIVAMILFGIIITFFARKRSNR